MLQSLLWSVLWSLFLWHSIVAFDDSIWLCQWLCKRVIQLSVDNLCVFSDFKWNPCTIHASLACVVGKTILQNRVSVPTKANLSYRVAILKLPPPPCTVLLVVKYFSYQSMGNYSILIKASYSYKDSCFPLLQPASRSRLFVKSATTH